MVTTDDCCTMYGIVLKLHKCRPLFAIIYYYSTVVAALTDRMFAVEGGETVNCNGSPPSGEVSPVSQMSPYNMSPLSASPAGSAGVSPIAGNSVLGPSVPGMTSVLAKIHSRRFREYVIYKLFLVFPV